MVDVVEFLSSGDHPVELSRYASAGELQSRIERGYVLVKFTDTRGGTELGVRLDKSRCAIDGADFDKAAGRVRLLGTLTLDFVDVECEVDIDVASLAGQGRIRVLDAAAATHH
ncbi:MAG: hypothetical protein BGP24_06800 [Lysobacterales bacterium 69-70]|jgi:hypothetical protein|nr:hypothetical protein [Xanthomonadaceae bacterium]ODU35044.1 MAG: hypothetical protein ABS97_07775 [Xanthomonadaceae bacterium SCN 69-320]ODV20309.1 MAG: hypothetical protein ABT27_08500 [Xanthomonadaceae bacterium SCN 69-25]OJY95302.1 MAG: hypothetical protein BGP24_06800 [Xanthomonadales bacterium 69-70]